MAFLRLATFCVPVDLQVVFALLARLGMPGAARSLGVLVLATVSLLAPHLPAARAGGGPENVLLVVNQRSWASMTVANFFIRSRQIPPSNVLYLDWDLSVIEPVPVDLFRQRILQPIIETVERRSLSGQIDYVIYAPDFPFHVYAQSDAGEQKLPQGFAPYGSINSMTYLWQLVATKNVNYMQVNSNHYFRPVPKGETAPPSLGFRGWYGWGEQGQPQEGGGIRYLLSTMLAVTSGRGTTVGDAIRDVRLSALADESVPAGTIYFARNRDVRSQVRQPLFEPAVAALETLGVKGVIFDGMMPGDKDDVQGLTMGAAKFDWAKSGSTIRPGAICDNFTSTGGLLQDRGNQTPLSVFLAAGAAGASGTVVEPLAINQKFPTPFIHVHYARGCSLAESFYQSVEGPFQLLIVGDPLCRPWAKLPKITNGLDSNRAIRELFSISPTATTTAKEGIRRFQLFLDGRLLTNCQPGDPLAFDSREFADGYHELTIVAVDGSPIESQGRQMFPIKINNHDRSATIAAADKSLRYGETLKLTVTANGASRVGVYHQWRRIARIDKPEGELELDSRMFGLGPVRLHAVALDETGEKPLAISEPLMLEVDASAPLKGKRPPQGSELRPGFELKLANGRKVPIEETFAPDWLTKAGIKPNDKYSLSGYVEVGANEDPVHQFQFACFGKLTIRVDGVVIYQGTTAPQSLCPWHYLPVSLAPGSHFVEVEGEPGMYPRLEMRFGGPGSWAIGKIQFRYPG